MGVLGTGRLDVETEDNQDQVAAFQKGRLDGRSRRLMIFLE